MNAKPYRLRLHKRLLSSTPFLWFICILLSLVVRALYLTCRIHKQFPESIQPYAHGKQQAIFCFWHGRMIFLPFMKPPPPMRVLTSIHRDGKFIATVMRCFHIGTIRGSTSRGAAKAVLGLLQVIENGANIAMTPDGPRGPVQKAAPGAAFIAAKTGLPLIPISFSATRYRQLNSWDRFFIPLPFSRVSFIAHDPIHVAADADDATLAAVTQQLEDSLNAVTAATDLACGVRA